MHAASSRREVPFFNYPHLFSSEEEKLVEIFRDVGRRGAFIMQKDLAEFETALASYLGAKHAVGMADGTNALVVSLLAAGVGPGDEVIFSSHTMVATAAAIHFVGATPVPVECGPDHLMDPASAAAAVTKRTRALMPTQLNGRTCDMDALRAIADRHGLLIVEDAAQALGSRYKGRCAGTFGIAAGISFYPAKVLGCLGDGGALITNDDAVHQRVLALRDHGRDHTGEVTCWGLNARLDNLQAAILGHRLKGYAGIVARRREIAATYQRRLGDLPALRLPPAPGSEPDRFDIFQNYEIEAERRDQLREHLKAQGIGTLIQWGGKAVHQFARLGFDQKLPYTEALFTKLMMLPINMALTDEDVEYVCAAIRGFYRA